MSAQVQKGETVTCHTCKKTWVPSMFDDFYSVGNDPTVGQCERCMLSAAFGKNTQEPQKPPSAEHLKTVCRHQKGPLTCAFLGVEPGGLVCLKNSMFEPEIRARLSEDSMVAKGDYCSGVPAFTPTSTPGTLTETGQK
jgi:hypothetical protein